MMLPKAVPCGIDAVLAKVLRVENSLKELGNTMNTLYEFLGL